MRKIKEVLRLRFGLSLGQEEIARSCSIAQATVHRYLERAATAGLTWPLPDEYDDRRLNELLSEEYRETQPGGYRYSRFCELYRRWSRNHDVVLRQDHKAGEKMFVDWAGSTVAIHDNKTGDVAPATAVTSRITLSDGDGFGGLGFCGPMRCRYSTPADRLIQI
jgi:hypothetical protein